MKAVVVVNGETMGYGSAELGRTLTGAFLRKLAGSSEKPVRVIFYNSAVKLLAEGSPALDALALLADAGVDLVACGTCVDFFGLKSSMKLGRIGSMDGIVEDIMKAGKVVTI